MIILMLVSYFMDGNRLQVISEERDLGLGVITSEDLKWGKQCVAVVKQGNKILEMIKRNFHRLEETTLYFKKKFTPRTFMITV